MRGTSLHVESRASGKDINVNNQQCQGSCLVLAWSGPYQTDACFLLAFTFCRRKSHIFSQVPRPFLLTISDHTEDLRYITRCAAYIIREVQVPKTKICCPFFFAGTHLGSCGGFLWSAPNLLVVALLHLEIIWNSGGFLRISSFRHFPLIMQQVAVLMG